MKTMIITLLIISYAVPTCYGQQNSNSIKMSAEEYRAKAKKQRTTAAVLGIPGVLFFAGAIIYDMSHLLDGENHDGATVLFVTGAVLTVASVPFIIAADYNAKKAKKLSTSFILQRTPPLVASIKSIVYYPAVTLKISL